MPYHSRTALGIAGVAGVSTTLPLAVLLLAAPPNKDDDILRSLDELSLRLDAIATNHENVSRNAGPLTTTMDPRRNDPVERTPAPSATDTALHDKIDLVLQEVRSLLALKNPIETLPDLREQGLGGRNAAAVARFYANREGRKERWMLRSISDLVREIGYPQFCERRRSLVLQRAESDGTNAGGSRVRVRNGVIVGFIQ